MTFLKAIARQEGFYKPGSRASRNNNPGNIEWGDFARSHGAVGIEEIPHGYHVTPRFAHFPDPATGFAAMRALFQTHEYAGSTVRQCLNRYAPASENNVSPYEADVCLWVGL
jgi:hypothetical protein